MTFHTATKVCPEALYPDSTGDVNLFRIPNATGYATGLLDSLIIVDYVPSLATQNTAVGFLKRQSGIS